MQQLRSAPARARHLQGFARFCSAWLLLAACDSPTWVVLRSKCDPADGSANDAPGACAPEAGTLPAEPMLAACKRHVDCPFGSVCEKNLCVDCAASRATTCPASCLWKFSAQPFKRNGCALCECAPPNACTSDLECGAGMRCYPGQQCQDGCSEPGCCFGNVCSFPGCEGLPPLPCDVVGCESGTCSGDPSCSPSTCKCDGKAFVCADDCPDPSCVL